MKEVDSGLSRLRRQEGKTNGEGEDDGRGFYRKGRDSLPLTKRSG